MQDSGLTPLPPCDPQRAGERGQFRHRAQDMQVATATEPEFCGLASSDHQRHRAQALRLAA